MDPAAGDPAPGDPAAGDPAAAGAAGCRSCGTPLIPGASYCTECGTPVVVRRRRTAEPPGRQQTPRLVECDACGAGNAASRPLCARCGTPLRDEIPGGDALPEPLPPVPAETPPRNRRARGSDSPSLLLSLVILAGLITAGVLLSLVTSRVTTPPVTAISAGVAVQAASASTAVQGHPASLAVDGDPATAWAAPAPDADGDGEEWVELALTEPAQVGGVVMWNGDQDDEVRWTETGVATAIRIEVGDRQFRVDLQQALGPQAVDLPEPVTADRVRIVIEESEPGTRTDDVAISEVVLAPG